jgi:hypothetical protein
MDNMKVLLAAILLSAPVLAADQLPAAAVVKAACGPDSIKFNVTSGGQQPAAQAGPGKALVYVVEQFDRPVNALVTPTLRIGFDGSWVGANYGTSHLFFSVDPGEHHLCSDWQSFPPLVPRVQASLAGLTAEAGQTYYFRARIIQHSGNGPWTLDLERINDDEGQMLVATSPRSGYRQKK